MKGAVNWVLALILGLLTVIALVLWVFPKLKELIDVAIGALGGGRDLSEEEMSIEYGMKALFVKIDPDDSPVEIWAFHLTDKRRKFTDHYSIDFYFQIGDTAFNNKSNCILFTADERPHADNHRVYYINSSAIIQEGCGNNLNECIGGDIIDQGCSEVKSGVECATCVNCRTNGGFAGCCDIGRVLTQNFTDVVSNKCKGDDYSFPKEKACPTIGCCNLLQGSPTSPIYKVKDGLICNDEGRWKGCTKNADKYVEEIDGITYECKWDGTFGKWEPTGAPSPPPGGCSDTYSCSGLDQTNCDYYSPTCSWTSGCTGGIAPNPECRGARCTELSQSSCSVCGCTWSSLCTGSGSCSGLTEGTCKFLQSLGCRWT